MKKLAGAIIGSVALLFVYERGCTHGYTHGLEVARKDQEIKGRRSFWLREWPEGAAEKLRQ